MTYFAVPFHLDEQLADFPVPLPAQTIAPPRLTGDTPWERMASLYVEVAEAIHRGDRPIVFTGDCSASLGVLAGLQRRGIDPAVVWFDAHGDLNTPRTSLSGYLGGMPLAQALGHGDHTVAHRLGLRRVLPEQVLLVDARDLDPDEGELIAAAPLLHVPVGGVSTWMVPDGPVYLHIDLDVLDPDELAPLRYPAAGGPSLTTVVEAVRTVVQTGRVAAVSIAITTVPEAFEDQRIQNAVKALLSVIEQ